MSDLETIRNSAQLSLETGGFANIPLRPDPIHALSDYSPIHFCQEAAAN